MSAPLNPVLSGTTVAVTAHRRAQEQGGAFERHGARVVYAPALKLAPADEDDDVLAAARDTIASAPGTVLVTTGYGVKRWLAVAQEHGLREDLLAALRASTVLARGAKAKGQLQALEIPCAYTGASGRTSELVDRLLAAELSPGQTGTAAATATSATAISGAGPGAAAPHVVGPEVVGPVTVQVHGTTDEEQLERLRAAGLDVRVVAPYRWESADEGSRLADLVHGIVAGRVDYVTFTAAPAVDALFDAARSLGAHDPLVAALREGRCAPVAIGPVCVQPLEEAGIDGAVVPQRFRLGAMVRAVCDHAEAAASR
ncbi:uroporphyrinogen III synthase [Kocuria tytonicola]|uniref:Uroporphyrinogen III synthase n=1 Tax=Kocuria tytonicola TaxID=2055946 RepID=A0A3L9L2G1_9MICC|nr:uroporphyrinogen-III synthase [Kocuria tytonicola]RLY92284.1 uroporphyrinogen III synthase [Kocuria tytonicola]